MDDRQEWNRRLFESLTSKQVSRNKYFAEFANDWFKAVHRRFRIVSSIKKEAGRLGVIPDTNCWIHQNGEGLFFHLQSPRMHYERVVALQSYEWEWLHRQEEIRSLLVSSPGAVLPR